MDLSEDGLLIRRKVDHAVRNHNIKGPVVIGNDLGIDFLDLEVCNAGKREILPCPPYHLFRQIYSAEATSFPHQFAGHIQVKACAASEIEENAPGIDPSQGKGITDSAR